MRVEPSDALIVVDVQKDFCPGGALAVADGDAVVPVVNSIVGLFGHVVATRDWHPTGHCSFSPNPEFLDGSWPEHCVAGSAGAGFHEDLRLPDNATIVSKGVEKEREAYSGFQAGSLAEDLVARGIRRLFVCGLATDYCVKFTALDGLKAGFEVVVIEDGCRGVDVPSGSVEKAVADMRQAGVEFCLGEDLQ